MPIDNLSTQTIGSHAYKTGLIDHPLGTQLQRVTYDKQLYKIIRENDIWEQFIDRKFMILPQTGKIYSISTQLPVLEGPGEAGFGRNVKGEATDGTLFGLSRDSATIMKAMPRLEERTGNVNQIKMNISHGSTTIEKYGAMIPYTGDYEKFTNFATQMNLRSALAQAISITSGLLIQNDLLSGTNVYLAGSAITSSQIGKDAVADGSKDNLCKLQYLDFLKIEAILRLNQCKPHTSMTTGGVKIGTVPVAKGFRMLVGPEIAYDLKQLLNPQGDLAMTNIINYGTEIGMKDEIGAIEKLRIVEIDRAITNFGEGNLVPNNYVGDLSWTEKQESGATVRRFDIFHALILAQGAYATIGLSGQNKITINSVPPKSQLNDPYGNEGFVSGSFWFGGIIPNEAKVLRIDVAGSRLSGPIQNTVSPYKVGTSKNVA